MSNRALKTRLTEIEHKHSNVDPRVIDMASQLTSLLDASCLLACAVSLVENGCSFNWKQKLYCNITAETTTAVVISLQLLDKTGPCSWNSHFEYPKTIQEATGRIAKLWDEIQKETK
jgi:hypothetical protein